MKDIKRNSKERQRWFILSVLTTAFLLSALTLVGAYEISKYCLSKAEKSNISESIRYYETANLFWPISEQHLLRLAGLQFNAGDYLAARSSYGLLETKEGYLGSTKAEYAIGGFADIAESDGSNSRLETNGRLLLLAKSYLKLGRLGDARRTLSRLSTDTETLELRAVILDESVSYTGDTESIKRLQAETSAGNKYILAYNELETRGFPQAAISLLHEGYVEDVLSRDGLLALAQAQIDLHDHVGAEQSLLRAASLDAYYPQTFNQLVTTEKKLGNASKANEYSRYLASIAW